MAPKITGTRLNRVAAGLIPGLTNGAYNPVTNTWRRIAPDRGPQSHSGEPAASWSW